MAKFWKTLGQCMVFGHQQLPDLLQLPMSRFNFQAMSISYWTRKKFERQDPMDPASMVD